jgi:hypothetical protein
VSSGSAALFDDGFVDPSDVVVPLRTSPLLLMVTPGATCVLEAVSPDAFVVSLAVLAVVVDGDPVVEVDSPCALVEAAELESPVPEPCAAPVDASPDAPLLDDELDELDDESDDVPVVSAADIP